MRCASPSQQVCGMKDGGGGAPLPPRLSAAYPRESEGGSLSSLLLQAMIPSIMQPPWRPLACPPASLSLLLVIHQAQLWVRTSTSTWTVLRPPPPPRPPPLPLIRLSCGTGPQPQHGPRDRQPKLHEQALERHKVRDYGRVHTLGASTSHTSRNARPPSAAEALSTNCAAGQQHTHTLLYGSHHLFTLHTIFPNLMLLVRFCSAPMTSSGMCCKLFTLDSHICSHLLL